MNLISNIFEIALTLAIRGAYTAEVMRNSFVRSEVRSFSICFNRFLFLSYCLFFFFSCVSQRPSFSTFVPTRMGHGWNFSLALVFLLSFKIGWAVVGTSPFLGKRGEPPLPSVFEDNEDSSPLQSENGPSKVSDRMILR